MELRHTYNNYNHYLFRHQDQQLHLPNLHLSLVLKFRFSPDNATIATPANINSTITVITNAISVITFS